MHTIPACAMIPIEAATPYELEAILNGRVVQTSVGELAVLDKALRGRFAVEKSIDNIIVSCIITPALARKES